MTKRMGCSDRAYMVAKSYQAGVLRIPESELMRQANEVVQRAREQRAAKAGDALVRRQGRGRAA